jgi:hypothetical protein
MGGIMAAAVIASGSTGGGGGGAGDPQLTVSLSPANRTAGSSVGGHVGNMSALAAGGNGVYTYAWTVLVPDDTYALTINHPAAATTDFDFTPAVAPGVTAQARVRCTVTSNGQVAHADGLVSFVNNSQPPVGGGGSTPPGFGDPPQ